MNRARILVVEDERIIALDIQRRLESLGYEVVGRIASGEEAVRKAGELRPNLVLMDIHLKGEMDGIQAADDIRAHFDLPVIFLTAFADRSTLEQAGKAGAFGYILKPFDDRELAIHIEMALYKHRTERELNILRQAAIDMTAAIDLEQVQERVLMQLENVVPYDSSALFLVEGDELVLSAGRGFKNLREFVGRKLTTSDLLFSQIKQSKTPLIMADAQQDPRFQKWGDAAAIRGWLGVPLMDRGEVIGLLTVDSYTPAAFGEHEAKLALALASQASIAIQNARLFQQVQNLAITDALTGLYNRRKFYELVGLEFDRSRRYQHELALLMIDMDFFKQVNDTFGHLIGDRVLQEIAQRLKENFREVDILVRYGGEEFVAVLPETGCQMAHLAAERFCAAVATRPVVIEDKTVRVTASIGVACFHADCTDYQMLLDRADQALYAAKQSGRNNATLWNEGLGGHSNRKF